MVNDNPAPCARCGHPAISHAYGNCRECAQQELDAGHSVAPPAHSFLAPADAIDLVEDERVRNLDAKASYDAWFRIINDQDARGH